MDETFVYTPAARKARIEIIPLIDVIFFLLATFVLFTLSLDKIGAISVPAPQPGPEDTGKDTTLYLQASDHGTFYWKEGLHATPEVISAGEIPARLEDYRRRAQPRAFSSAAMAGPASVRPCWCWTRCARPASSRFRSRRSPVRRETERCQRHAAFS